MDIMKVNMVAFLSSISRGIKFGTCGALKKCDVEHIMKEVIKMVATYKLRGFRVESIAADNAFAPLRNDEDFQKLRIVLNITTTYNGDRAHDVLCILV